MSVDDEWDAFSDDDNNVTEQTLETYEKPNAHVTVPIPEGGLKDAPIPSELYISTKTEIAYLNIQIPLYDYFWKLPIISYNEPKCGVIKKQMKAISNTEDEYLELTRRMGEYTDIYVSETLISKMTIDIGSAKFKDVRKVSIGISRKDLTTNRTKKKGAFYNCFVMIVRMIEDGAFKEYHCKIFNTGKIELPGIKTIAALNKLKEQIVKILQGISSEPVSYIKESLEPQNMVESILINSNFDCNFYIDRQRLFTSLKYDYNLNCIYDPCTYPGVRCSFYYNDNVTDGIKSSDDDKHISFMIFRTGSVLIVGKCSEFNLYKIYNFIRDILIKEYHAIQVPNYDDKKKAKVIKKTKKRINTKIADDGEAAVDVQT